MYKLLHKGKTVMKSKNQKDLKEEISNRLGLIRAIGEKDGKKIYVIKKT
jgi:hypothetical protein